MAESSRAALYARLVELLGDEHAMTLMDALTPPGSELATRSDIQMLEQRLEQRFERLELRFDQLEQRFEGHERHMERFDDRLHGLHGALRDQTRIFMMGTIGSMTTLAVLAFAAATIV